MCDAEGLPLPCDGDVDTRFSSRDKDRGAAILEAHRADEEDPPWLQKRGPWLIY